MDLALCRRDRQRCWAVARGVTGTVGIGAASPASAGVAIHMAIAAMLGMAVAAALAPLRLRG